MIWYEQLNTHFRVKVFMHIIYRCISLCIIGLFLSGCAKESALQELAKKEYPFTIKIRNITKQTLYATCFTYMKKAESPRWRWNKTNVYELAPNREVHILIDTFTSPRAVPQAYGVLGVFTNYQQAQAAIYELTPDENKIDLDRIDKLKNKTIILGIEKYGVIGDIFDYSFIPDNNTCNETPELDFIVENKTGKTLYTAAFIYQKKENMPTWRYDKSEVIKIENDQSKTIDVDTITNTYDRKYTRGYLAVFDETEEKEAFNSTFQLLKSHQMINLGLLSAVTDWCLAELSM